MSETKKDSKKEVKKDKAVHIKFLAMDLPRIFAAMSYGLIYRPKRVYVSKKRPDKKGGALVIANHSSFTDPVLIGISMGRRMWYLAGELAMGNKLKSFLLSGCGCIGIDRNISDRILAGCKQNTKTIFFIQLPVVHDNVQQPTFGNQPIEKGKKSL